MRTPEQINNLRTVLSRTRVGPFAWMASDEDINTYADHLQNFVNSKKYTWSIKVKIQDNVNLPWTKIKEEPTMPYCSIKDLESKCKRLFLKYPMLLVIMAKDVNASENSDPLIFERDS